MKTVILKRLQLKDWKSKNIDIDFSAGITNISGKNEIGKSSLQQAWNWLLTSYTTPNSTRNEELFDNKFPLSPDTPTALVKAWLDIDGTEYTIERSATAKFKRPRGQVEYVKDSSDAYSIKIDDIEVSATSFNDWLENVFCPIAVLPFVLEGAFFTALAEHDKKKARKVLEDMVGDISAEYLSGDYSSIKVRLDKYGIQQLKEQVASKGRPIKKRMEIIPAIIKSKAPVLMQFEKLDNKTDLLAKIEELSVRLENNFSADAFADLVSTAKTYGLVEWVESEKDGIRQLQQEQKELASQLADCEGDMAKINEYCEEVAMVVEQRINQKMPHCSVCMYTTQVNGDKVPDCVLTDKSGVRYATLSNSARLRINLAVQDLFRKYYGVNTITWVDEASVFDSEHLPKCDGQTCYMFASDSETLTVECK